VFCADCGKENVKLVGGLCKDCYLACNEVMNGPEVIEISYCPKCGKYFIGAAWTDDLSAFLSKKVKFDGKVKDFSYELGENFVILKVKGIVADCFDVEVERKVKVEYTKKHCEQCHSKVTGFWNAKVQIRGSDLDPVLKFLNSENVSKIERVRGGADIFFRRKEHATYFANVLAKKWKTKMVRSTKLVGMSEGERLFKTTLLVRMPASC
jgi:NMD protein affecting ribosome stability and mRNA decay